MNSYDSEKIMSLLAPHGFTSSDRPEDADLIVLNTCHIREKASEKMYSELGRLAQIKKKRQAGEIFIVVAGCVAQAEGAEIIKRAPCVDIVVGPQSYHKLPILIERVKRENKWIIELNFGKNEKFDIIENLDVANSLTSALISIQEGCDKFCSFCVVPYTRGKEYSRPPEAIYKEALKLCKSGVKEVTLLGQNVSAYRAKGFDNIDWRLGRLIKEIAQIDNLKRIRYITSHPNDMDDEELFEAHAEEAKLMPYIHLPIQSGSNKILRLMNRKYTAEMYVDILQKFRKYRQDIAFSSDFIVGYPGETDEDFQDTMTLVRSLDYAQTYSFKYSSRPGTPAAALPNQVEEDVKRARLTALQELLKEKQLSFNESKVGQKLPILIEKPGKKSGQIIGKSPYMQVVVVDIQDLETRKDLIGQIKIIDILSASQNSLYGTLYNGDDK